MAKKLSAPSMSLILTGLLAVLYSSVEGNFRCKSSNECIECDGACPASEVGNNFPTIFECQMFCQNWDRVAPNPGRGDDAEASSPAPLGELETVTGGSTELTTGFDAQRELWACYKDVASGCQSCDIAETCKGFSLYRSEAECSSATENCQKIPAFVNYQCISGGNCVPCNDESPASTAPITCDPVLAVYDDKETCNRVTGCTLPDWGKTYYQCTKGRGKSCTKCKNGKDCVDNIAGYKSKSDCEGSKECSKSGQGSGGSGAIGYQCPKGTGSGCSSCEKGVNCKGKFKLFNSRAECELSQECGVSGPVTPAPTPRIRPPPVTEGPTFTDDPFGVTDDVQTETVVFTEPGGLNTNDFGGFGSTNVPDATQTPVPEDIFFQCPGGPDGGCEECIIDVDCDDLTARYASMKDCKASSECSSVAGPDFGSTNALETTSVPLSDDISFQCPGGPDRGCEKCFAGLDCDDSKSEYATLQECNESPECSLQEPLWQCTGGEDQGCSLCNVGGISCIPDLRTFPTDIECLNTNQCQSAPNGPSPELPTPSPVSLLPAPAPGNSLSPSPGSSNCGVNEVAGCSECENNCDDPFAGKYVCDRECPNECRCIADGQYARDRATGTCKTVEACFDI